MHALGWRGFRTTYSNNFGASRRRNRRASKATLTYWTCLRTYFDSTLLHGYRYVTELGRSKSERGLWLFLLLLMICGVTYVITDYYLRFINAPTATSQQAMRVPISEIPFPTVVICPATRLNRTAIAEMANEMQVFLGDPQFGECCG